MTVVLVLLCLAAASAASNYNSSDLSYLSNGIQFPAPPPEPSPLTSSSGDGDRPEMLWLEELFDHFGWSGGGNGSGQCAEHLDVYLAALKNGTSWAAKMYDASGRYSGQFFFGNDYWLGSERHCQELTNKETNSEVPPFPVTFSVAKIRIHINEKLTPVTRQLNVGECLPSSCGVADIRQLLSKSRKPGTTLNIVDIRPVPGSYKLFEDVKFQAVAGAFVVVAIIVIVASFLEIATKKNKSKEDEEANNNNEDNKKIKKDEKPKQNIFLRILLSFSAINNMKKIFNIETVSEDSIQCIHGLRFFSIAWIILVHTYLEVFAIGDNKNVRILAERTFMYQTVSNATFSVDTFFFISGLLVTITFFRHAAKKPTKSYPPCRAVRTGALQFFMLVIYRFFRLTPPYLFVLGTNEVILRFLHSYSVFSPAIIDHISCSSYWWRNALYINNFYPQTEFCMLWSWYIANDTQFYLIGAILLIIAVRGNKHLKFAATALGFFMVASWIITFVVATKYNYTIKVEEPFALFDQLYDKPWMRVGPYFIGMLAGYFMFRVNCKVKMSPILISIGWILSISCLSSLVYGVGKEGIVLPTSAVYASLGHTAWALALAFITVACSSGYGGPVNSLLKFKLFVPLSRLTYCAYLVHPVLMCLSSFILDGPMHLHEYFELVIVCGNIVLSFIAALIISLTFEAPVVNLLKIIF